MIAGARSASPALGRTLDQASAWMAARSRRERVLIVVMTGVLALALAWYGVVRPVAALRTADLGRIAMHDELQARLRASDGAPASAGGAASLSGPVDEALRAQAAALGVTAEVADDDGAATVRVADARYDALARLVAAADASAALESVELTAVGPPGQATLDLRVIETAP